MPLQRFLFIRHTGQEVVTADLGPHAFVDSTLDLGDTPLSPKGISECRQLVPILAKYGVKRLISSRLRRAAETATILAEHAHLPYEHRWTSLNEIPVGHLPPHTHFNSLWLKWCPEQLRMSAALWLRQQARRKHLGAWARQPDSADFQPDEAEKQLQVTLHNLIQLDEPVVAVVGHAFWISVMVWILTHPTKTWRHHAPPRRWVSHGSLTLVEHSPQGEFSVRRFGETVIRSKSY